MNFRTSEGRAAFRMARHRLAECFSELGLHTKISKEAAHIVVDAIVEAATIEARRAAEEMLERHVAERHDYEE